MLQALAFGSHLQNAAPVHGPHWASQLLPIRSRIPNPGSHALPYQIALKLRDRRHDGEELRLNAEDFVTFASGLRLNT